MPKYGFQLPLTKFEQRFLKTLWVAPTQLTAVAWCYISSLERLFEEFCGEFGELKPTLGLFANYFSLCKSSKDFISVKRKSDKKTLFDIDNNLKVHKVHD